MSESPLAIVSIGKSAVSSWFSGRFIPVEVGTTALASRIEQQLIEPSNSPFSVFFFGPLCGRVVRI